MGNSLRDRKEGKVTADAAVYATGNGEAIVELCPGRRYFGNDIGLPTPGRGLFLTVPAIMATTVEAFVPIFAWAILGMLLRLFGVASRDEAGLIFRLVFFLTLPALVFVTISATELTLASAVLPLAGFLVNLSCAAIAFFYARTTKLDRHVAGVVVLGASVTNMAFMFPFILGVLGPEAFVMAILYDIGNAIFVAAVAYTVAMRYGRSPGSPGRMSALRVLRSPLLLAVFAAIIMSLGSIEMPGLLHSVLTPVGAATMPLILIALGISMSAEKLRDAVVYSTVLIRMLGGLVIGLLIVLAFDPGPLAAVVVIASASAPIGFNLVTFASISKLDVGHATASLSLSIIIGLFATTAIILTGSRWLTMTG